MERTTQRITAGATVALAIVTVALTIATGVLAFGAFKTLSVARDIEQRSQDNEDRRAAETLFETFNILRIQKPHYAVQPDNWETNSEYGAFASFALFTALQLYDHPDPAWRYIVDQIICQHQGIAQKFGINLRLFRSVGADTTNFQEFTDYISSRLGNPEWQKVFCEPLREVPVPGLA